MMPISHEGLKQPGRSHHRFLSIGLLAMMVWPTMIEAAETPQDRYHVDMICEARGQTGLPIPNQTADKTKILSEMYARRVQLSGHAAGKTPAQIAKDIAYWRGQLLQEAHTPEKPKASANPLDVGKLGEYCAGLPVFEMIRRMRGGNN